MVNNLKIEQLSRNSFEDLGVCGTKQTGYKAIQLLGLVRNVPIYIFCDELGVFHLAIIINGTSGCKLDNISINGLDVGIKYYKLGEEVNQCIDIGCNGSLFLDEFTEVVREVSATITTESSRHPIEIVNEILTNWKAFWSSKNRTILGEETLLGLICELCLLKLFIAINPANALRAWRGPLREQHDFLFSACSIEVKATFGSQRTHIVNGVDQLSRFSEKELYLVSYLATKAPLGAGVSVPEIIEEIRGLLGSRKDLLLLFNELLTFTGYNQIYQEEYNKIRFFIGAPLSFEINDDFPSITREKFKEPLSSEISEVQYRLSLMSLSGKPIDSINLGDWCY